VPDVYIHFGITLQGVSLTSEQKHQAWVRSDKDEDPFSRIMGTKAQQNKVDNFHYCDALASVDTTDEKLRVKFVASGEMSIGILFSSGPVVSDIPDTICQFFTNALKNLIKIEALEKDVRTDPLTGTYNRRAFDGMLSRNAETARNRNGSLSVIMFDIDHFKSVNDTYGHDIGDTVLKQVAEAAGNVLRKGSYIIRYGGEEFLVVLPETDCQSSIRVAERMRTAIEELEFTSSSTRFRVTASFGVADYARNKTIESMVRKSDQMLYRAKTNGRNTVIGDVTMDTEKRYDSSAVQTCMSFC
jgi:diguanylate cyclase (GGDEF)-like protein